MKKILLALSGIILACTSDVWAQGTIPPPPVLQLDPPVSIAVDLGKPIGAYKPIYGWFGFDEANYATAPNGRKLLRELHDLSPVPIYIRSHHLLTSGDGTPELKWSSTNVYSEDAQGKPIYDFKILDGIFDAYKEAGVRPLVELGFMPKDLAAGNPPGTPQDYQIHFPGRTTAGTVQSPPKDYGKWRDLVRAVTAHFVQRYGRQTVLQWYFEVWNEPDGGYWHSTPDQYWKLYDYAAAGVRAALPGARVGGPATTPPTQDRAYKFLGDFLDHVNTGKSAVDGGPVPMDFISFHIKGQPKAIDGLVHMGLGKELNDAVRGFGLVARYPKFRNLPIILSEADPEGCGACSSRQNPANGYRNDTMYPTYTAAAFKALFELQDRYKINLISMLNWAFEFENKDYFEGFRSLATNGIDLPVLNAVRMFSLMDGTRVAATSSGRIPLDAIVKDGVTERPDIDAMATRSDRRADVLVWNYHDLDAPGPATPAAIAIGGIPAGVRRVMVTHWRIDDTHSNAYTVWKAMGSPQSPTPEQYAALKASDGLQSLGSPNWADVTGGKITINTQMPRLSVSLIQLQW